MSKENPSITERLKTAIEASTIQVFETMLSLSLQLRGAIEQEDYSYTGDIVGIIGIAGKEVRGSIAVHLDTALANQATSLLLSTPLESLSEEYVLDAVGEIANMVAGGVKAEGENNDILFDISVPTVVAGKEYTINFKDGAQPSVVPFHIDSGKLKVEFCVEGK